ncbi:MAG: YdcF family protein [Clostridia bacterium]|nr:YdcF family protein [Clostridia bacterium]
MHGTGVLGITLRAVLAVIFLLIGVWGVLPTLTGRFHSGCLTMILVGTLGFISCIAFPQLADFCSRSWQSGAGRVVLCAVAGVVGALVLLFIGLSVCMIRACNSKPSEGATLIVLGAALREDQPSELLRGRLEAAYGYLTEHPDASCIVSGGQGEDEICTEASVMHAYLVEKGIDPARIFKEDASTSTFENIRHSRELIEQHGLSTEVAVVTQEFHQFRAQQFVKRAGLTVSGAVTAYTPWHLLPSYWIRDFAGICHMALLGT